MSSTSNSSSSGARWAMTKTKTFLECHGQNLSRTGEKSWKNQTIWSQQSSKEIKKCHILNIFPVLGELTHIHSYICTMQKMKFLQVWEIKNYGNNNFFWHLCSSYDQLIGEHFRSTRLRQVLAKFPGFVNLLSVWRLLTANVCQTPSKASPINAHCCIS